MYHDSKAAACSMLTPLKLKSDRTLCLCAPANAAAIARRIVDSVVSFGAVHHGLHRRQRVERLAIGPGWPGGVPQNRTSALSALRACSAGPLLLPHPPPMSSGVPKLSVSGERDADPIPERGAPYNVRLLSLYHYSLLCQLSLIS